MSPTPPPIPLTHFTNFPHTTQGKSSDLDTQKSAEAWLPDAKNVKSVYIHVPFCFHKCHYCDFFSIAGAEDQYEPFVLQLSKELEYVGGHLGTLDTIFIGGGTPTLFEPQLFDNMLQAVSKYLPRSSQCEWTVEANPETITLEKAESMVRNGVNRISIGAQSFHPTLLKSLERWHDPENVGKAVECVRSVGIQDINLDVIYAIPSQTMDQLLVDLEQSIALSPTHMSCYSLIYEPNTPLRTRLDRGEVQRIEHELEASMFIRVIEVLQHAGYSQYEISNFAKKGTNANIIFHTGRINRGGHLGHLHRGIFREGDGKTRHVFQSICQLARSHKFLMLKLLIQMRVLANLLCWVFA